MIWGGVGDCGGRDGLRREHLQCANQYGAGHVFSNTLMGDIRSGPHEPSASAFARLHILRASAAFRLGQEVSFFSSRGQENFHLGPFSRFFYCEISCKGKRWDSPRREISPTTGEKAQPDATRPWGASAWSGYGAETAPYPLDQRSR